MKREIKFRAWDGKYMHLPELCDNTDFFIEADGDIAYESEIGNEGHTITNYHLDWDIMQFIGMKDKNGVEIYEGDIIKSELVNENVPVEYDQKYAQFTYGGCEFNVENGVKNIEVIGNIHQNKELLT